MLSKNEKKTIFFLGQNSLNNQIIFVKNKKYVKMIFIAGGSKFVTNFITLFSFLEDFFFFEVVV